MEQTKPKRRAIAVRMYIPDRVLNWSGWGSRYAIEFEGYDWSEFDGLSGVFMFAQDTGKTMDLGHPGKPRHRPLWHAVYVGRADDVGKDLPTHPKWQEAADLGATHVILMLMDEDYCMMHVWNWLEAFRPLMNEGDHVSKFSKYSTCCGIYAGMEV